MEHFFEQKLKIKIMYFAFNYGKIIFPSQFYLQFIPIYHYSLISFMKSFNIFQIDMKSRNYYISAFL